MVSKCLLGWKGEKGGAGLGMRNIRILPSKKDVGMGVVAGKGRFLMGGVVVEL